MKKLLYLSLSLNFVLLALLFKDRTKRTNTDKASRTKKTPGRPDEMSLFTREQLQTLAKECEAKLPETERDKIKLLIDTETEQLAALQIETLKISLSRNKKLQSLFYTDDLREALIFACNGYDGTGRYIPVPQEVRYIMQNRTAINIYLEALGLEQIPKDANFFCLDVQTGWKTGWKRFDWNINVAFDELVDKQRILDKDGKFTDGEKQKVALFLLLKGWEHLFIEA